MWLQRHEDEADNPDRSQATASMLKVQPVTNGAQQRSAYGDIRCRMPVCTCTGVTSGSDEAGAGMATSTAGKSSVLTLSKAPEAEG